MSMFPVLATKYQIVVHLYMHVKYTPIIISGLDGILSLMTTIRCDPSDFSSSFFSLSVFIANGHSFHSPRALALYADIGSPSSTGFTMQAKVVRNSWISFFFKIV